MKVKRQLMVTFTLWLPAEMCIGKPALPVSMAPGNLFLKITSLNKVYLVMDPLHLRPITPLWH